MQVNVSGHHLDVTGPIHDYATKKLNILHKHCNKIVSIDLTVEVDNMEQIAKATIFLPKRKKLHVTAKSSDMYASIDELVSKLDRQVIEYKSQLSEH